MSSTRIIQILLRWNRAFKFWHIEGYGFVGPLSACVSLDGRDLPYVVICLTARTGSLSSVPRDTFLGDRLYKSSVVAEMGDRLATTDNDRELGAAVPLSVGGSWVPI